MDFVVLLYRSRDLRAQDIHFIQIDVAQFYGKGRSEISRVIL